MDPAMTDNTKPWCRSRTLWFNALAAVLLVSMRAVGALRLLAAALAVSAGSASAQGSALFCASGCRAVTDPFDLAVTQPVFCNLYGIDSNPISAPVVPGSTDTAGAPAGSVACSVPFTLTPDRTGTITITATAVSAEGLESPHSAPFIFVSYPGAPDFWRVPR